MTFGCQMNVSDSERINTIMKQVGFDHEPAIDQADFVIMNTCSVKQKAEDKVWGQFIKIREMRKRNPNVRVALTGCMVRETGVSQKYEAEEFQSKDRLLHSSKDLDFVFRIEDLPKIPNYLSVLYGKQIGQDHKEELESYFNVRPEYASTFQVFVPVQTGCNKFCTYCIVPFTRKREISRPMQEIIDEVRELVEKGAKEVTLLGQTVNSYRHPSSTAEYSDNNFAELLYHINKIPGLTRIRYTSPHPMDMNSELIRAHVELEKVCNHVHLPVQSGDTNVLRRMNRKYSRERYLEVIKEVKDNIPGVTITTDIIVGFCGETEEEFMNTYDLFKEVGFEFSFTSRYSPRKGTYSDKRLEDDVPAEDKARRWHMLNELLKELSLEKNKTFVGQIMQVLVERQLPDGRLEGMSRNMKRIQFDGPITMIGTEVPVKITGYHEFNLLAKAL